MTRFVVTGTDTGIGKTVFAAGLTEMLGATYWKPVQSGLEEETDSQIVARLSGRPTLPEAYRLKLPASPHISANAEGAWIDPARLTPPDADPLVVEGAGGLMVPLNNDTLYLDVIAGWGLPVILCARTALGTINHSLLSLAALRAAGADLHGIAFIGKSEPQVEDTITRMGKVRRLGRLPFLADLTPATLGAAFAQGFDAADFRAGATA